MIAGGASWAWMRNTAQTIADILPDGRYRILEGQDHNVAPEAIAPLLEEFFRGQSSQSRNPVSNG